MTGANEYVLARGRAFCNFCPGYCCYRLPGASLLLDATDINRLARHFGLSDGSCILLANDRLCKRCTVHTARPLQCRAFPYDKPCPYLERPELLAQIQPRIERALLTGGEEEY
jgi:Fe-S-cluster containining protein